jgi:uncharacterized protein YbjT (DUF2867 family)
MRDTLHARFVVGQQRIRERFRLRISRMHESRRRVHHSSFVLRLRGSDTVQAMKIVVFGATGGTGRELCRQATAAGHDVTAFVRGDAQLDAKVVKGNLFAPDEVERVLRGADGVATALGAPPLRHSNICSEGTRAIAAAMAAAGVKRIVVCSSQGTGDSKVGPLARLPAAIFLRNAFRDKGVMETELAATALDWIVVRPGLLTNGKPRGTWRAAEGLVGGKIGRADVAAFMLQQLASDEWLRKRPVLVW